MKPIEYETESEVLKALAHPLRLKLVDLLSRDDCCVTDMANCVNVPQSTVSQNLGILKKAGIIQPYKSGVRTCYKITDEKILAILNILKK